MCSIKYILFREHLDTIPSTWAIITVFTRSSHWPLFWTCDWLIDWLIGWLVGRVHILTPCQIYFIVVRVGAFTSDGMNYGFLWCDVMFCSFVVGITVLEEPATSIIDSIEDEGSRFLSTSGFCLPSDKLSHPQSILISLSHPGLDFQTWLFPSAFSMKTLYAFLMAHMRVTFTMHLCSLILIL